jgi:L-ribulose-5-phosphate 4-epimerase
MANMLESLKKAVCEANLRLVEEGLVVHTFGNASGLDRERGLMAIKPSGVPYAELRPAHMVVVDLDSGKIVEGKLKPSSDTETHLELYRSFDGIGGIVHTHSFHATAWAQTGQSIPALGTTHADYFHGKVPCTRQLTPSEIKKDYEYNTGRVIVERFKDLDPMHCPAVLVAHHGPFTWGTDAAAAVENAAALEFVARLAAETLRLRPEAPAMPDELHRKHFFRKHGPSAHYGQTKRNK